MTTKFSAYAWAFYIGATAGGIGVAACFVLLGVLHVTFGVSTLP